jgi:hypothetical protein
MKCDEAARTAILPYMAVVRWLVCGRKSVCCCCARRQFHPQSLISLLYNSISNSPACATLFAHLVFLVSLFAQDERLGVGFCIFWEISTACGNSIPFIIEPIALPSFTMLNSVREMRAVPCMAPS